MTRRLTRGSRHLLVVELVDGVALDRLTGRELFELTSDLHEVLGLLGRDVLAIKRPRNQLADPQGLGGYHPIADPIDRRVVELPFHMNSVHATTPRGRARDSPQRSRPLPS